MHRFFTSAKDKTTGLKELSGGAEDGVCVTQDIGQDIERSKAMPQDIK